MRPAATPKKLFDFELINGDCPVRDWLETLVTAIRARIEARLIRVSLGNLGDAKSVGEGVSELRLQFGSGYRVYFSQVEEEIILLLCGGDKSSQGEDIRKAKLYLEEFKSRGSNKRSI